MLGADGRGRLCARIEPVAYDAEAVARAIDRGVTIAAGTDIAVTGPHRPNSWGQNGAEVGHLAHGGEDGGLSGAPVKRASDRVLAALAFAAALKGEIPIIGVGGILSGADAADKMRLRASLVQIYSGLIYRGPALVAECAEAVRGTR